MATAESVMEYTVEEGVMDGAAATEAVADVDPAEEAQSAFYDPRAVMAVDGVARMLQESLLRRW